MLPRDLFIYQFPSFIVVARAAVTLSATVLLRRELCRAEGGFLISASFNPCGRRVRDLVYGLGKNLEKGSKTLKAGKLRFLALVSMDKPVIY